MVQVMGCHLFAAKPLLYWSWLIVNWTIGNFSVKYKRFLQENAFENVICKIQATMCGIQYQMGEVTEVRLSRYLVLLSLDSKTKKQNSHTSRDLTQMNLLIQSEKG